MVRSGFIFSLWLLVSTAVFAQQTASFSAVFEAMVANQKRTDADQFASLLPVPSPNTTLVRFPFTSGEAKYPAKESSAYYTYEDGILQLMLNSSSMQGGARSMVVYSTSKKKGSFVGRNAYGVAAKVQRIENISGSVQFTDAPVGMTFPMEPIMDIDIESAFNTRRPKNSYWVEMKVTGPLAQNIINSTVVEITLASTVNFISSHKCSSSVKSAEIDHPFEVASFDCSAVSEIERIRFIRTDTQEVIGAWPSDKPNSE